MLSPTKKREGTRAHLYDSLADLLKRLVPAGRADGMRRNRRRPSQASAEWTALLSPAK